MIIIRGVEGRAAIVCLRSRVHHALRAAVAVGGVLAIITKLASKQESVEDEAVGVQIDLFRAKSRGYEALDDILAVFGATRCVARSLSVLLVVGGVGVVDLAKEASVVRLVIPIAVLY